MTVSRMGAGAAVLGGLVWVAAGLLSWGDDEVDAALDGVGLALMVAAGAALGYALVATAPVWLRAVVSVATPLLGVMVWLILRDALPGEHLAAVVSGLLLAAGGGIALLRLRGRGAAKADDPPRPVRGRRAAR